MGLVCNTAADMRQGKFPAIRHPFKVHGLRRREGLLTRLVALTPVGVVDFANGRSGPGGHSGLSLRTSQLTLLSSLCRPSRAPFFPFLFYPGFPSFALRAAESHPGLNHGVPPGLSYSCRQPAPTDIPHPPKCIDPSNFTNFTSQFRWLSGFLNSLKSTLQSWCSRKESNFLYSPGFRLNNCNRLL